MRLALAFLMFGVSPVAADSVTITNCTTDRSISFPLCEVTNNLEYSISALSYSTLVTTEGRAVPWVDTRGSLGSTGLFIEIRGGIEPKETITKGFPINPMPSRAESMGFDIQITPTNVKNAAGDVISLD